MTPHRFEMRYRFTGLPSEGRAIARRHGTVLDATPARRDYLYPARLDPMAPPGSYVSPKQRQGGRIQPLVSPWAAHTNHIVRVVATWSGHREIMAEFKSRGEPWEARWRVNGRPRRYTRTVQLGPNNSFVRTYAVAVHSVWCPADGSEVTHLSLSPPPVDPETAGRAALCPPVTRRLGKKEARAARRRAHASPEEAST